MRIFEVLSNFNRHIIIESSTCRVDVVKYFVHSITKDVAAGNVVQRHRGNCDIERHVHFTNKWWQIRQNIGFISSTVDICNVVVLVVSMKHFGQRRVTPTREAVRSNVIHA